MAFENIPEFDALWDKYVPMQGEAKTEFGEAVRALGRLEWDMYNNGFQNAKDAIFNSDGDDEDDGHDWHDDIEGYEWNHYYLDLFNKLSDFVSKNGGPRDAMDIIEAATPENDSGEELFSDACKTLKTFLIQKEPKETTESIEDNKPGWCVVDDGVMVDGPFDNKSEAEKQAKFLSDIPGSMLSVKWGKASDKGFFEPVKYMGEAAEMPDHDFDPAALDRIMYEIEVETGKRVTAELSDVRMVDNQYRATIGLDNDTYIVKFDCNSEGEDFDLGYINRSNDTVEESVVTDVLSALDGFAISDQYK